MHDLLSQDIIAQMHVKSHKDISVGLKIQRRGLADKYAFIVQKNVKEYDKLKGYPYQVTYHLLHSSPITLRQNSLGETAQSLGQKPTTERATEFCLVTVNVRYGDS